MLNVLNKVARTIKPIRIKSTERNADINKEKSSGNVEYGDKKW